MGLGRAISRLDIREESRMSDEVRYLVICPDEKIRIPFFLTQEEANAVCHRVNYYNPDFVGLGQRCCTLSAPVGCPNGLHRVETRSVTDLREKDLLFVWVPKGMRVA